MDRGATEIAIMKTIVRPRNAKSFRSITSHGSRRPQHENPNNDGEGQLHLPLEADLVFLGRADSARTTKRVLRGLLNGWPSTPPDADLPQGVRRCSDVLRNVVAELATKL